MTADGRNGATAAARLEAQLLIDEHQPGVSHRVASHRDTYAAQQRRARTLLATQSSLLTGAIVFIVATAVAVLGGAPDWVVNITAASGCALLLTASLVVGTAVNRVHRWLTDPQRRYERDEISVYNAMVNEVTDQLTSGAPRTAIHAYLTHISFDALARRTHVESEAASILADAAEQHRSEHGG